MIRMLLAVSLACSALEESDIPIDAPQDEVMAGPEEVQAMLPSRRLILVLCAVGALALSTPGPAGPPALAFTPPVVAAASSGFSDFGHPATRASVAISAASTTALSMRFIFVN